MLKHELTPKGERGRLNVVTVGRRRCNLCGHKFLARAKYELYCKKCRRESELFHFSEWLPEPPDVELLRAA